MIDFKYIQQTTFFIFLFLSTFLFLYIIKDFLFVIFWALVLSIIFYPFYKKILNKLKNHEVWASLISLFLIFVIIIVPVFFTVSIVAKEAIKVSQNVSVDNLKSIILNAGESVKINQYLNEWNIDLKEVEKNINNFIKNTLNKVAEMGINFGKETFQLVLNFFLMLYLIFFFLKDGERILRKISDILPLGNKLEMEIFQRFSSIIKSIFKGSLIVALVQGAISALFFLIVGVESVLLWWVLMTFLALIPAVGPSLVLIPFALFLFFTGAVWEGILLLIGVLLVSSIDNILRPVLVGRETKMPDLLITLSIFGGMVVFGVTGLVIGPVIAGIFITAWAMFEKKFENDLKKNG